MNRLLIIIFCTNLLSCSNIKQKEETSTIRDDYSSTIKVDDSVNTIRSIPQDSTDLKIQKTENQINEEQSLDVNEIEDDCIFNNDYKELTIEWLNELEITDYIWRPDINSAVIPFGKDSVFATQGGCYHFGISVELKTHNNNLRISDSTILIQKALELAYNFEFTQYVNAIKNGELIKAQDGITKLWYDIPDDNEDDNLYYTGIQITVESNDIKINLSKYYN